MTERPVDVIVHRVGLECAVSVLVLGDVEGKLPREDGALGRGVGHGGGGVADDHEQGGRRAGV